MITATPALMRLMASFGVMPLPPAAFSPFAMMKSTPVRFLIFDKDSITAFRPGSPTMSPRNRIRIISGGTSGDVWSGSGTGYQKGGIRVNPMLSARDFIVWEAFWQILDAHSWPREVSSAAHRDDKDRQPTYRTILDWGGSLAAASGFSGIWRVHGAGDR